ncbi:hypothetical protein N7493_009287 [Penicillium malachiteum]|uniref:Carrier domain-containing protein n=1 Tax=Penicillium malachiteum TaxID=1324776 RepID=A0AAD6MTE1_9EURO|nr:hypothetical protein N7493_009287 [Penicillium malachiteum]
MVKITNAVAAGSGSSQLAPSKIVDLRTPDFKKSSITTTQSKLQQIRDVLESRDAGLTLPLQTITLSQPKPEPKKQKLSLPRSELKTRRPLPFEGSSDLESLEASTYISKTLESQFVDQIKFVCKEKEASTWQFISAALQSFFFRYANGDLAVVLQVQDQVERPPKVPAALWTVLQCEDCAERDVFDLAANIKRSSGWKTQELNTVPPAEMAQVAIKYQIGQSEVPSLDFQTEWGMQFHLIETSAGVEVRLEFPANRYDNGEMERFLENFMTALTSIVANPSQALDTVPLCGPSELAWLSDNVWNTGYLPNPWGSASICQKIIERAWAAPNAVALSDSALGSLTYSELIEQVQRAAASLLDAGVTSGDVVCLMLKPGISSVVGMLATMWIRGCYVYLSNDFASERLATIITDSGAKTILFETEVEHLANQLVDAVSADEAHPAVSTINIAEARQFDGMAYLRQPEASDVLYMVYTSGSTGTPKGVVISQSNAQQMLSSLHTLFGFSNKDRFLQQTSLAFDISFVQVFSALCSGAQVCIAEAGMRKDPVALANFIQEQAITVTYFTPTHFALLLEHNSKALRQCQQYRIALFAGERLPARLARAFYDLAIPATMYNGWGPSEPVVQTTFHKIEASSLPGLVSVPIGTPLANCRHYVVDSALNPLPAGLVGEMCVTGPQVGLGYRNRPEATAKAFVQSPFASEEDKKRGWTTMYRTGDKGRFLAGGALEFHGRVEGDKQIKLRGFRIDLGEVEEAMFQRSMDGSGQGIVDISIVARTVDETTDSTASLTDDRQMIAFIVPKVELKENQSKTDYATFLHQVVEPVLNYYMLPNGYQFLEELPTTVGGKVDRMALMRMNLSLVHPSVAPKATESSETITADADTIKDVTKVMRSLIGKKKAIAPTDNFFHIGGQSVLLIRLQSKLKKKFGISPPLQDLFSECTPLAIATNICKLRAGAEDAANGKVPANSVNWSQEVLLAPSPEFSNFNQRRRLQRNEVSNILLTGADTYIGIHMLSQLLNARPDTTLYLLGTTQPIEEEALNANMTKYELFRDGVTGETLRSRVKFVPGCLSAPKLGLSDSAFSELATTTHAIYNIGAEVSLLKTYHDLRSANTDAIRSIIALANSSTTNHVSEIHHLSTWSVLHMQTWYETTRTRTGVSTAEENASHFSPPDTNTHGYLKTRWVAEMILTEASRRGLPVSIYRSSAVSGSLATGVAAPKLDLIHNMIMNMIQSRRVPDVWSNPNNVGEFVIDFIPVDSLTSAISGISSEESLFKPELDIYHLGSSRPLPIRELGPMIMAIREEQMNAPEATPIIDVDAWLKAARNSSSEQQHLYWTVVEDYMKNGHRMLALENKRSISALEKVAPGAQFPQIDAEFLRRMWTSQAQGHQ